MTLAKGDHLGPYEILALVGKGGMGQVYRAHDDRLNRDVAIKVSSAQFTERFTREARTIAALNHTNICHLYDVGPNYLVMEYVEGPDLATALRGPLDFNEALPLLEQLIDGIEAAHEKNIVHRDLKPANIKITSEGVVKILDFGLAKAMEPLPSHEGDPENSPTFTMGGTQAGTILGTAAYMSPEQAKGKIADRRADIWSFGVVVFEMLTGQHMFQGESAVEILGGVLNKEPDLSAAPVRVHELLRWCLEKDRRARLASISDARRLLRVRDVGPVGVVGTAPSQSRLGATRWIAAVAVLAVLLGALAFVHFREALPERRTVRFQIAPPEKLSFQEFRLSPDGRNLVFTTGDRRLWIRSLDSLQAQLLPGTEGATDAFWSPDGQSIGFFAQNKLKKIGISSGPPQILCDAPNERGGTWNRDGAIIFAPTPSSGLFQVAAAGGVPVQLTKLGSEASADSQRYPEFLPDGRHFLYTAFGGKTEAAGIYVGSLDGKPSTRLLPDLSGAVYTGAGSTRRNGYLLFRRGDTLMALPFDPNSLRITGDVFPVAERVGETGSVALGAFSVSDNGMLAYGAGISTAVQLVWTDRAGKSVGLFGPPGAYNRFRLAPDEKRAVFDVSNQDIWVLDSVRGVSSRLTYDPTLDNVPMWSPDGLRILWSSNRGGGYDLYLKSANGTGHEELLIKMGTGSGFGTDWSRDGRFILYQIPGLKTGQDLWIAPQFGDRKPFPYLQTAFEERDGMFSPDGKWVAYVSNESGSDEIYVQSFPPSGAKFQISTAGGSEPQWPRDGTELFYLAADQMLMAVPVKLGRSAAESFQTGLPKPLVLVPGVSSGVNTSVRSYAVSNDGQRLLIPNVAGGGSAPPITVVLNWVAGLKN